MRTYKESKMFSEWIKKDHHRIYLKGWAIGQLLGFEFTYYKTGSISTFQLYSEYMSNSEGGRVKRALFASKVWFDVNSQTWAIRLNDKILDLIPDADKRLSVQLECLEKEYAFPKSSLKEKFETFRSSAQELMINIKESLAEKEFGFLELELEELKSLIESGLEELKSYDPFMEFKKTEIGDMLANCDFGPFFAYIKIRKEGVG